MIGLNQDCELIPTTKDFYGKRVKGTPIPTDCRVKESYEMVKNNAGEDVVSNISFSFDGSTEIDLDTLIQYDNEDHHIISISPKRNLSGNIVYKKVFV